MRGDILYLLLVISAFSVFFAVILWLQVTDARHRSDQASVNVQADPMGNRTDKT
ncbi:hypothetical protein [Candidatus Puniceispirillum marinum]|uniref:Uncharacterized protein n=1 Tax=Puniceispirillum marinum (strain IMCC1322) TaxID=488538 RepID=D5BP81_PUNMI|nr:hypothetical protein [Candidatus Puniceispirillum marinum]ADE38363.1 hypothetical protein SAR116_0120 [Candidatus Puniceispirillum marinum IMCC1322]